MKLRKFKVTINVQYETHTTCICTVIIVTLHKINLICSCVHCKIFAPPQEVLFCVSVFGPDNEWSTQFAIRFAASTAYVAAHQKCRLAEHIFGRSLQPQLPQSSGV